MKRIMLSTLLLVVASGAFILKAEAPDFFYGHGEAESADKSLAESKARLKALSNLVSNLPEVEFGGKSIRISSSDLNVRTVVSSERTESGRFAGRAEAGLAYSDYASYVMRELEKKKLELVLKRKEIFNLMTELKSAYDGCGDEIAAIEDRQEKLRNFANSPKEMDFF